ncbi:MAG: NAD(P)/FAD-dependent oxidoreductase [Thalassovita sp.]
MTSDHTGNLWRAQDQNGYPRLTTDIHTDFLIVGGGYTGCSAALEAARCGADVLLLEANTIGHGGSGRNVGLANAGMWVPPQEILKQLGQSEGMRMISSLAQAPDTVFGLIDREDISCEATRNGTMHLAHARSGLRDLQDRYRQGNQIGAPLQLLDTEETARRTGSAAFHGALFDPRAGTIQPLAYCRGLARAASAAGARIFQNSPVKKISRDGDGWRIQVNGHDVRAKRLLMATNGYHQAIEGMPATQYVSVRYSQFATVPLTQAQRARILPGGEGCWDTALVMSSIRMTQEGRLVIGGIGDCDGPGRLVHTRWAARKLAQLYPQLEGTPFEFAWQGQIAMTKDHLPKVLSLGPNALSVYGYSGRGIGPGTVYGMQAARALLFDELDGLPSAILTQPHREAFKGLRSAYYETGATLTHALPR